MVNKINGSKVFSVFRNMNISKSDKNNTIVSSVIAGDDGVSSGNRKRPGGKYWDNGDLSPVNFN